MENNNKKNTTIVKSGYLKKKEKGTFTFWRKRWFQIVIVDHQMGQLSYSKKEGDHVSKILLPDLCCLNVQNGNGSKYFRIITVTGKIIMLKAETEKERDEWVSDLKLFQEFSIQKVNPHPRKHGFTSPANKKICDKIILLEGNYQCAECYQYEPEWASITLGILVCRDCAGAHRKLGSHISRIKSLNMDIIDGPQWNILMQLGNSKVNSIYAASIRLSEINIFSSQIEREAWVKRKYVEKKFSIKMKEPDSSLEWKSSVLQQNRLINPYQFHGFCSVEYEWKQAANLTDLENFALEALKSNDLGQMMNALVQGLDVNNPICGTLLLHLAIEKNMSTMMEFLLLNRANPHLPGGDGNTALHIASRKNSVPLLHRLLLSSTNADIERKNEKNETVLDVAQAEKSVHAVALLQYFKLKELLKDQDAEDQYNNFLSEYTSSLHKILENIYRFEHALVCNTFASSSKMPKYWTDSSDTEEEESSTDEQEDAPEGNDLVSEDLNIFVELQIRNLIQLLSTCIKDICKEEKMKFAEMRVYRRNIKRCLASIEMGLSKQLNIMEESLLSVDVNCCSTLYDHEIQTMKEMFQKFKEIYQDIVFSKTDAPSA